MVIKSFRWQLMFESQGLSVRFMYFPCWQKLKQKVRVPFPHKLATDMFSECKLQQCFSDFQAIERDTFIFQIHLTVQLRTFHLTINFKWLICNITTCKRRVPGEKSTKFYKCCPGKEYARLKSAAGGMISLLGSTFLCEQKTFSKMKYVNSYYRSTFATNSGDREH